MIYVCLHREPGPVKGCPACCPDTSPDRVVTMPGKIADAYVQLLRAAERCSTRDEALTNAIEVVHDAALAP